MSNLPNSMGKRPQVAKNSDNRRHRKRRPPGKWFGTRPEGFESGSDVATMTLLCYAPSKYHKEEPRLEPTRRESREDQPDGVSADNLVTVLDGIMKDQLGRGNLQARMRRPLPTAAKSRTRF